MLRKCGESALIGLLLLGQVGFTLSLISLDLSSSQIYVDDQGRYQDLVISINLKMENMVDEKSYLSEVEVSTVINIFTGQLHPMLMAFTFSNPSRVFIKLVLFNQAIQAHQSIKLLV